MTLAGHETREVDFTITGGAAEAANNYRLLATFDAGADGVKKHAELMHANVIARRTITVDGNLDDWQGVMPQTSAQTVGANASEKAYLPFQNWDRQSGGGSVTAWLAADDQFFYFAAKVPRMDGLIRYETRNDDEYLLSGESHQQGQGTDLARRRAPLLLSQGLRHSLRQRQAQRADRLQRHSAGAEGLPPVPRRHDAALLRLLRHGLRVRA